MVLYFIGNVWLHWSQKPKVRVRDLFTIVANNKTAAIVITFVSLLCDLHTYRRGWFIPGHDGAHHSRQYLSDDQ